MISLAECGARGGDAVLYDDADPEQAQKLWQESAAQGDPLAQNRLGQIYEIGIGGTPDYAEAAKWYKRAADSGNRAAAINLAALYERGQGVPKDVNAAVALYRKARGLPTRRARSTRWPRRERSLQAQKRINALEKEVEERANRVGPLVRRKPICRRRSNGKRRYSEVPVPSRSPRDWCWRWAVRLERVRPSRPSIRTSS